jgi:hypothetical protein
LESGDVIVKPGVLIFGLAAMLLASCAGKPETQTVALKFDPTNTNPDRLVCRDAGTTGSIISHPVCMKAKEWDAMQRESQCTVAFTQGHQTCK